VRLSRRQNNTSDDKTKEEAGKVMVDGDEATNRQQDSA
jgi:hypothetical protein